MKQYKDYPYMIDTLGNVFRNGKTKPLKPDIDSRGYQRVTLCKEGVTNRFLVHRMVAEVYIPNPKNKTQINHIDNNPSNNHVTNLEWCTLSENMLHCHRQNRCTNLVASTIAATVTRQKMEKKFKLLLKDAFISIRYKALKSSTRSYITFACTCCGAHRELRSDSPLFKGEKFLCKNCV